MSGTPGWDAMKEETPRVEGCIRVLNWELKLIEDTENVSEDPCILYSNKRHLNVFMSLFLLFDHTLQLLISPLAWRYYELLLFYTFS